MKLGRIAVSLIVLALAGAAYGQAVSFDFENMSSAQDLLDAGWTIVDDRGVTVNGAATTFPDTIQIETEIVHGGSKALRLGVADMAFFPLNGQFGTLELWAYDYGYPVRGITGAPTSAYGPRWGLRKFMDIDTSGYYPDNEPVDHGLFPAVYGIGAGMVEKTFLDSTDSYATEWGMTQDQNISTIASPDWDLDPANPIPYAGWAGHQSWWSPSYLGYLPNGRPATGGWNHWRIAYTAPGVVEITLLESWAGDGRVATAPDGAPGHAFDGTVPGGADDIYLYGGATMIASAEPETWFGDGIYDDITWTPLGGPTCNPGDADGDGDVDLDDFVILKNNFGTTTGATCAEGDFDDDSDVDLDDFVLLKNNFGVQY